MVQQRRSVQTIESVLSAARDQFAEHGYTDASIDDIARSCGRTKGTIYHHFPSKDVLFEAVFIAEQRRIASQLATAIDPQDPVAQLQAGLTSYLQIIAAEPEAARITLIDAPTVMGWQRWRTCDNGPFRIFLVNAIEAIRDAGRLGPGHTPVVLAELLLGATTEAALTITIDAQSNEGAGQNPDADTEAFALAIHQLVDDVTRIGAVSGKQS